VNSAGLCGAFVELVEFVLCAGEAGLEPFGLAEPSFEFGFGDAVAEVVAHLDEAVSLCGVEPEHGQRTQASLN
jgi:hypothetical protein